MLPSTASCKGKQAGLKDILDSIMDHLKFPNEEDTEWCSEVESTVTSLESECEITVCTSVGIARRDT